MKNNLKLSVFILCFCLFLPPLIAEQELYFPDTEVTISMDFKDANLKDILKIFSIQSGLNFIASESVQDRKITLYLDRVPIKEAMEKLFKANNLTYELDEDANIFIVKDWGKPQIETVTKIFYLKYASVSSSSLKEEMRSEMGSGKGGGGGKGGGAAEENVGITMVVKKILSMYGSVIEDYRTNSLIVTDIPNRMSLIAQTIAYLDVPVPQVMLEVEMLDVSKNIVDKLGIEFGNNPFTLIIPGGIAHGLEFFLGDMTKKAKDIASSDVAGSIVLGRNYAEVLDFLRTQTDTKYLARPRILTLNNETAEIKIATSESVGVKTTTTSAAGTTAAEAERMETGVSLRVTPQINMETSEITMFICPQVSEATVGSTITSADKTYTFRDPEVRSTKSIVRVKDGETVILGGLIRNELSQVIKKLPILGDIPILGALFRHKERTKDKQRELLVFITPHIIKETKIGPTQRKKVSLPEREQSPGLAFDRQLSIDTSLNSFEKIMK